MNRKVLLALAVWALTSTARPTSAATVVFGAAKDASIFQNNIDNASGGANGLIVGTNAQSSSRRAAVAFDVAGYIPAGAVIQSVQLDLVLGGVAGGGGGGGAADDVTIGLHRLAADWGEGVAQTQSPASDSLGGQGQGAAAATGDLTWRSNFHNLSTWTTPGGDFAVTASATATAGSVLAALTSWTSSPDLVADVQNWLDNPAANFGWMLVNADEATANTGRTFFSRNTLTESLHPQLTVTYATVPEPAAGVMAGLGVALLGVRAFARRTGTTDR